MGSLVGLESSGSGGSLPHASAQATAPAVASGAAPAASVPHPLRLPQRYEEAKEHKVQSVANLRTAVKSVCCVLAMSSPVIRQQV